MPALPITRAARSPSMARPIRACSTPSRAFSATSRAWAAFPKWRSSISAPAAAISWCRCSRATSISRSTARCGSSSSPDVAGAAVGREAVNGVATTKYRVAHRADDGTRIDGFVWLTSSGVPMRGDGAVSVPNGKRTPFAWELSQLQIGPQPALLFQPPDGFLSPARQRTAGLSRRPGRLKKSAARANSSGGAQGTRHRRCRRRMGGSAGGGDLGARDRPVGSRPARHGERAAREEAGASSFPPRIPRIDMDR